MERYVEFDFEKKTEREIKIERVQGSIEKGRFVWLDLETKNPGHVNWILGELLKLKSEIVTSVLQENLDCTYSAHSECIHLSVVGCRRQKSKLETIRVDIVAGDGFLVTYSRGFTPFLGEVRKAYHSDFVRFAKSPSFMIYELSDHLIRSFEQVEKSFESEVDKIQQLLAGKVDDTIFQVVSQTGAELLFFRRHVAPARGVLTELATRKSLFVSEATQPFLVGMVPRIERVLNDVILNRDIVGDSLELYMSMVGYRTNQVMNRLTVITFLALPLTFLTGIYGMDPAHIEHLPGVSFFTFSVLTAIFTALVVWIMRRMKLF